MRFLSAFVHRMRALELGALPLQAVFSLGQGA